MLAPPCFPGLPTLLVRVFFPVHEEMVCGRPFFCFIDTVVNGEVYKYCREEKYIRTFSSDGSIPPLDEEY